MKTVVRVQCFSWENSFWQVDSQKYFTHLYFHQKKFTNLRCVNSALSLLQYQVKEGDPDYETEMLKV